ncbi:MAG TPA: DUF6305 family protein [Bacillota bacterium]|nr:hypothetical protein [Bacillota bacterium]HOA15065.1 DUF6305 family protein [Bacillota bacterium]HOG52884.1 DUF6305 family protein [Bacillota bacterium]
MRKLTFLLSLALMMCAVLGITTAATPEPRFPIYMTTSGQGPDGMMLDILMNKAMGIPVKFDTVLKAEDCQDVRTLIFVVGYSGKGMTAAGINDAGEEARVKALVELAAKNEAYVVIVHMGGTTRRGASSDKFTDMAAVGAHLIVVIPDSNKDGYFNKMAEAKGAKLKVVEVPEGGSVRTLVAQALKEELASAK